MHSYELEHLQEVVRDLRRQNEELRQERNRQHLETRRAIFKATAELRAACEGALYVLDEEVGPDDTIGEVRGMLREALKQCKAAS